MRTKINDFERDWIVHPRPNGGDLILTADSLVAIVDTYHRWAMIWGGPGGPPERLRQSVVDKLLEAELRSTAKPYSRVAKIVPGSIFKIQEASPLSDLLTG